MGTDKEKLAKMATLVSSWRASGTGKKAFCAVQGINIHTFTYWVEKIEGLNSFAPRSPNSQPTGFIQLTSKTSGGSSTSLELRFPQGAVLHLGQDLSAASVEIVKSLLY